MMLVSRALAGDRISEAFYLLEDEVGAPVATAFLLEMGVPLSHMPTGALYAIARHKARA